MFLVRERRRYFLDEEYRGHSVRSAGSLGSLAATSVQNNPQCPTSPYGLEGRRSVPCGGRRPRRSGRPPADSRYSSGSPTRLDRVQGLVSRPSAVHHRATPNRPRPGPAMQVHARTLLRWRANVDERDPRQPRCRGLDSALRRRATTWQGSAPAGPRIVTCCSSSNSTPEVSTWPG